MSSVLDWVIRFDLRAPGSGAAVADLYAASIEMAEWADRAGFSLVRLSEHHAASDGYLPSPLVMAAAMAARTSRIRIRINALLLPLHDPVRVAEDLAVTDLISGGRMEALVGAGYRPSEFEMFGVDAAERGALVEAGVRALRQAWLGEPFEHRGRAVLVRPRPVQRPHPPLLLGGSSVAAARRAARLDLGFHPTDPRFYDDYQRERQRLGLPAAPPLPSFGPPFLHVADDPERAWATIAPHALHEANSYAAWLAEGSTTGAYQSAADVAALRQSGSHVVVTPEECVDLLGRLAGGGPGGGVAVLHPLMAGLDPAVAWSSLELIADRVMPAFAARTGAGP